MGYLRKWIYNVVFTILENINKANPKLQL